MICWFRGNYSFLSNFHTCEVEYDGLKFQNSESAFQASKTLDLEERKKFQYMSGGQAKKAGKAVKLRSDWEEVKIDIMYEVCSAKFRQNENLKKLLLDTGDEELIEGNYWHDYTWGVCKGKGHNALGKILMIIRDELREEED